MARFVSSRRKRENRDPYLEEDLIAFPYVNGGLFAEESIEIPRITDNIRKVILENGCGFDWSEISPTIFGAVFESTLNQETRRKGGMHYTSIENIHKVIDPFVWDSESFLKVHVHCVVIGFSCLCQGSHKVPWPSPLRKNTFTMAIKKSKRKI